jgi:hypothetical protein
MRMVRLAWVEGFDELKGVEGEIDEGAIVGGNEIVSDGRSTPGPAGVYRALTQQVCETLDPEEPAPTFLHESHVAGIVQWSEPLQHKREEAAAAERVRKAVFDLVEERIKQPGTFSASPIRTIGDKGRGGLQVTGRCVLIWRAA